jgi:c-di-GMP-binding flagellar brake protein YcgR
MRQDNRIHPRLLVRLACDYQVAGSAGWHRATILDLSAGGASLITLQRVAPQQVVRLRFRLLGEEAAAIEVETVVLRTEPLQATGGNVQHRQALHFLDLRGDAYEHVRRYIFERREGMPA